MIELQIRGWSSIAPSTESSESWCKKAEKPNYKEKIPAMKLRRMNHLVKMGVYTAAKVLEKSQAQGVICGTDLGLLSDTQVFLEAMVDSNEAFLNPTAFISSTHNSVASQIAIYHQLKGYNSTHTQRLLSFENTLIDAYLRLKTHQEEALLCLSADEIIPPLEKYWKEKHWKNNKRSLPLGEGCGLLQVAEVPPLSTSSNEMDKANPRIVLFPLIYNASDLFSEIRSHLREEEMVINCHGSVDRKMLASISGEYLDATELFGLSGALLCISVCEALNQKLHPSKGRFAISDAKSCLFLGGYGKHLSLLRLIF